MQTLTRRGFGAAALALAATGARATEPDHDITAAQDFDELWRTLAERYAFFGEKTTDWGRVRDLYRPMALAAPTLEAFQDVIRQVLGELYDAHTHLGDPPDGAPRWPLYDLHVRPTAAGGEIVAVKDGSSARAAGLQVGDIVTAIDGSPIATVVAGLAPKCLARPDPAALDWAFNSAVAGRRARPRRLEVVRGSGPARTVDLPLLTSPAEPDISGRHLDGGLGLIRIASFANDTAVGLFDAALSDLRQARGLILDVRGNGGGDTAVARPIMGRFIDHAAPYARMRRRDGAALGAPWTETVEPRGPFTFTAPVVVLCDDFSGSMAEGFPMGMRGLGRGRIVGRPMMGLGAAVFSLRLDRTGVTAQYSAEPVYDVNDRPRWRLRPDVETPPGADILAAGVAELTRLVGRAG